MTLTGSTPRMHPVKRAGLVRRIDVNWQDRALCAKFPADDWFPLPGDSQAVAEVVEVCSRCPVQVSCLAAALATGEEHGIWGGTTEADRQWAWATLARGASVPALLDDLLSTSGTGGGEESDPEAAA
jgi:WhiB family transcriptional regulator, redox-sensing transcriptional regulator